MPVARAAGLARRVILIANEISGALWSRAVRRPIGGEGRNSEGSLDQVRR